MAFGSFIKGLFAQVNPLDRGRTYSTVQKEEEEKRRKQQAQAPKPQKPVKVQPASPRPLTIAAPAPERKLNIANLGKSPGIQEQNPHQITESIRNIQNYNLNDQVRLLQRATRVGVLDQSVTTPEIKRLLKARQPGEERPDPLGKQIFDTVAKPMFEPFAKGLTYKFTNADKNLSKQVNRADKVNDDLAKLYNKEFKAGNLKPDQYAALMQSLGQEYSKLANTSRQTQEDVDISRFLGSAAQVAAAPFSTAGFAAKTAGGKIAGETLLGSGYGALNEFSTQKDPTLGGAVKNTLFGGVAAGGLTAGGLGLGKLLGKTKLNKLANTTDEKTVRRLLGKDAPDDFVKLITETNDKELISKTIDRMNVDRVANKLAATSNEKTVAKILGKNADPDIVKIVAETNDKDLIETILGLEVDKSIRLTGGEYEYSQEAADRLKAEGITGLKGADTPYGAEYKDGDIRLRDASMGRDEVLYHELGHDIWSKRVSQADRDLLKSLPPGTAQKNALAQGRKGYDLVEEDFADYVSLSLRGRSDLIPEAVRDMINRYAKVMANNAKKAGISTESLIQGASARGLTKGTDIPQTPQAPLTSQTPTKPITGIQSPELPKTAQPEIPPTPQIKAELEETAQKLGVSTDELVEMTKTKPASDISEGNVLEQSLYGTSGAADDARNLNIFQALSPNRLIRENVTRPAERGINKLISTAQQSENPIARGVGRLFTGANTETGRTGAQLAARRAMRGSAEVGDIYGRDIAGGKLGDLSKDSLTKIWAKLDPEQAGKIGKTAGKLTPEEQAAYTVRKEVVDYVTDGNVQRGLITPEQAANKDYLKRGYEVFEKGGAFDQAYEQTKRGVLSQFSKRKDVTGDLLDSVITDPDYLIAKKTAQSHAAWGMVDYGDYLVKSNVAVPNARPGYTQLPNNKLYGEAAGQYVPRTFAEDFTGFQYTIGIAQGYNEMATAYERLGIRRAKKALLTVGNPAVRAGNQFSNRVVFANMNGINPVKFNKEYLGVGKMIKNRDPLYLEAVKRGLVGTDITTADFARRLGDYVDENVAKKAVNWIKSSYSQADDKARITAFKIHVDRGYSLDEAAELTQRGFQDYSSVGFFYDLAAKTPLVGNAFVRFAGDAVRIAKNAAVDQPLRAAATVALWGTFVDNMSKLSGETPEDKKTREGRFGAPKIPFANTSLTVQTPFGEVNVARFLPFYSLNEVQGDIARFLPFQQSPVSTEGGTVGFNAKSLQDPLLGQFGQILADTDFRGKSIRDPENVTYDSEGKVKKYPDLSEDEQRSNVARFLFTQNAPLGRETDALLSASKGEPDVYGKTRSLPQAIGRAMGVKVEQFGSEQAKKQRNLNDFFDGNVERVKKFTKDNPDLEQAYYTFNSPTRDRETGKKTSNLVSPERWAVVKADASGRLYDFLKQEAGLANKKDGKPIDPVFLLPNSEQAKQVLDLRSRPTGDDIETEEILRATKPWYTKFEESERDYYAKNTEYFKKLGLPDTQNQRVKEYGEIKYPEQPDLIKRYYQIKSEDPQAAKDFYKANADQLSKGFDSYAAERLKYINAKRKIEGYPPIDASVYANVTFGYEDDERKVYNELAYGRGFGKGFGFGNKQGSARGSTDITNLAGKDLSNAFKELPKIRRQKRTTVKIPSAYKPRGLNIQSLLLPSSLPTFDSTKGKK